MELIKSNNDFYISLEKSLDEIDINWRNHKGLIVCGSHMPENIEEKLKAIRAAREGQTPFLGICFGMQLAAIEYAQSQGIPKATSEELGEGVHIVTKLPRLRVGMYSVDSWWATQGESHWHNYAVNPSHKGLFETEWDIAENDGVIEIMRYRPHPFFVGVQFHPEYQSSKDKPHPLLKQFIEICRK